MSSKKRKNNEAIRPSNFNECYQWFIEKTPKFYKRLVDIALGLKMTHSKMTKKQLIDCWTKHGYERVIQTNAEDMFTVMVQTVYEKLRSEKNGTQKRVDCNLHIGLEPALIKIYAECNPILITVDNIPNYFYWANIRCKQSGLHNWNIRAELKNSLFVGPNFIDTLTFLWSPYSYSKIMYNFKTEVTTTYPHKVSFTLHAYEQLLQRRRLNLLRTQLSIYFPEIGLVKMSQQYLGEFPEIR